MSPPAPPARAVPARRLAAAVFAALAACGDAPTAPPAASSPPPPAERETTSYPIRGIFIGIRAAAETTAGGAVLPARTREQAYARTAELIGRLRAPGADFAREAQAVSEDQVTRPDGGFVGFVASWLGDNEAVVAAVSQVAVGQVADAVEAPDGFHVLQRISREEGKALEARVVAPMNGILVGWTDVDASAGPRKSKADAYADAAQLATTLREGTAVEAAIGHLTGVKSFYAPLRRGNTPGWEALTEKGLAAAPDVWLDPVETKDGWAVARRAPYVRAIVRHLVVTHDKSPGSTATKGRTLVEADARVTEALARLDKDPGAWDQVVAEYSDEPASRRLGGFMGEVCTCASKNRRMVGEIEDVVLALKPGERSRVVETRLGFHVFWRVD